MLANTVCPFEAQALAFFHSGAVAVMVHAWLTTGAGLNVVLTHTPFALAFIWHAWIGPDPVNKKK